MPGVGAGGLIAGLMNPGMDEKLARSINPLNQVGSPQGPQGSPPGAAAPPGGQPPQQPQQAPAAVTAPDPYVASAGELLLKAQRVSDNANAFNQGLSGMAASFGTAQQQHDKMAALGNGANPQDLIGQYGGALKDQNELTKQQEHARFMGMVDVYAQTHGISREEAQMRMNNEGMLDADARAQGANETQTGNIKDAEAATRAWAAANPNATPQQIADYKASVLSMATGSGNIEDQQYRAYAMAERQAGREPLDKLAWVAKHTQDAKETEDAHKTALQLPGLKSQLTTMEQTADSINADAIKGIFGSISKQDAARQIFNYDPSKGGMDPATLYGDGRTLSREETNAVIAARKLHLANYAANFKEAGSGQRLSQAEAARLGASSDTLGNFSGTVDDYMERVGDVKKKIGHAMTNAHGEARDLDSLPVQYRPKIDPSFIEGPNALKNLPKWAQPVAVSDERDLEALPYGQAYKPASGKYAGKILFKGQESGYEDY